MGKCELCGKRRKTEAIERSQLGAMTTIPLEQYWVDVCKECLEILFND